MEALLSDTRDGRNRVEVGYGRIAGAALRNQERRERQNAPATSTAATAGSSSTATSSTLPMPQPMATDEPVFVRLSEEELGPRPAPQPCRDTSRERAMSDASIRSSPAKRPRDQFASNANESTEGQAPGPDDGSRGGRVNQEQSTRTSSQPKLTGPSGRGQKRTSDGDDDARHDFERAEDAASDEAMAVSDVGSKTRKVKFSDGDEEMSAVLTQGRSREDMAVVRNKFDCKFDIAEVYSPPRVVTVAEAAGLRGGFSLDLTVPYQGEYWDFTKKTCRDRALDLLRKDRPYLLIGSPPCTAWSNLQNLNACRPGGAAKVEAGKRRARVHLLFCARLYREQLEAGRYFLHEHPKSATSWMEKCMKNLACDPIVMGTEIDQCAYGLVSKDKEGVGPAKKPRVFSQTQ